MKTTDKLHREKWSIDKPLTLLLCMALGKVEHEEKF